MRRALALACLLGLPGVAAAQPIVWVRAETRIELRVERGPRVRVRATLRDDRGSGLASRALELRVAEPGGLTRGLTRGATDANGDLAADFDVPPGTYRFEARYAGDESYAETRVELLLDLERAHVRLVLAPLEGRLDRIDLDVPTHPIRVRAESDAGGAGLLVQLENELDEPLASGTTGADGSLLLTVSSEALGGPAAGRLVVRTTGDAVRAPAQTEVLVVRFRPTRLTLEAPTATVTAGQPLRVRGTLGTSEGPLARKAVGVFAGERHLETVLTDADGRFESVVVLEDADGPVALTARFESDAPWRPAAASDAVEVRVEPRGATSLPWLLLPIGVSALAILALFWRGRRVARAVEARVASLAPAPPGIHLRAPPGAREATRRDLEGVVLDADDGDPLGGARVTLSGGARALETQTDSAGAFALADVPDGRWTLRIEYAGYEAREATVELPHRGALGAIDVRLRSLRQLALHRYAPLAEALAPERRWWAFWTPRELAGRARAGARRDVEAVTDEVERAVWSSTPPAPEEVDAIGQRAARLAGEVRVGEVQKGPTAR
ncbi:MAG: carboxypeptidase regulatory-like domain-containing protein [Sandaracinaceae bacterium]|nr:carboxypeptidase regulatory-like domain-containing protein [Sandaracinaceae bacterium]